MKTCFYSSEPRTLTRYGFFFLTVQCTLNLPRMRPLCKSREAFSLFCLELYQGPLAILVNTSLAAILLIVSSHQGNVPPVYIYSCCIRGDLIWVQASKHFLICSSMPMCLLRSMSFYCESPSLYILAHFSGFQGNASDMLYLWLNFSTTEMFLVKHITTTIIIIK